MAKRLRKAERSQIDIRCCSIDDLLPADHRARRVWDFVERINISSLLKPIRSFDGARGAPATDPKILLALWLFATIDGVGSARELDELCQRDLAYQWICGGVSVNYHSLATFRSMAGPFLDDLLTRSVAALVSAGIVELSCIAVDSLRVRANAGQSSFRRRPTLEELLALSKVRVDELKASPATSSSRRRAAQDRAARERAERVNAAIAAVEQVEAARVAEDKAARRKTPKKRSEARASTTDPQARRMAMANGAIAPAYNLQIKTDPNTALVVGVDVTNNGSDRGKLTPAAEEIEQRYGQRPEKLLADVGFNSLADIELVETAGTAAYVPLPKSEKSRAIKKKDGPGVRKWKQRMAQDEVQETYSKRINTEHAHAQMRNHGLLHMPVRGVTKVKAVALLFAVAMNLLVFGQDLLAVI